MPTRQHRPEWTCSVADHAVAQVGDTDAVAGLDLPAGGIFSLSFGPGCGGVAVGGDFTTPDAAVSNAAWTDDRGATWHAGTGLGGYRSGSAWMDGLHNAVLAVGTSGSDVSWDGGRTFAAFDSGTFNAVDCVPGACYAAGAQGRVARLVVGR